MILFVSDNFPFNFIFTFDNFRILAPIFLFKLIISFILHLTSAAKLVFLIVVKMILNKL